MIGERILTRRPTAVAEAGEDTPVAQPEVLPSNQSLGALVSVDAEIIRSRELRKDRQEAVSTWLNIAGLKLLGFVALGGFIYEAFIPGAPQTISPPYLFAIAAACLAGPHTAEMILQILTAGGSAATSIKAARTPRRT
jgi:hypothetical protein